MRNPRPGAASLVHSLGLPSRRSYCGANGIGIASTRKIMNVERTEAHVSPQPNDPNARHGNGSPAPKGNTFARRAKAMISGFPSNLREELKRRPYATIGVACAIGLGTGILLSSRILRSVLASVASHALVELGRAYLHHDGASAWDSGPAGKTIVS
jgi:hypothetical protein